MRDSTARDIAFRIAAACVVLASLGSLAQVALAVSDDDTLLSNDFTQDYVSARAWVNSDDPYAPSVQLVDRYLPAEKESYSVSIAPAQRNPHTPVGILVVVPVSHLDYKFARVLWLIVGAIAIATGVALVARELGAPDHWILALAVGSFLVPVVRRDLIFGQSDPLMFLALVASWQSFRRRPDSWLAGALLGMAGALKLFPLLFLVPLLSLRRLRSAIALASTSAGLAVVSALVFGLDHTAFWLTEVSPANTTFWLASPLNVSLVSLPTRWLMENPWRVSGPDMATLAPLLSIGAGAACVFLLSRPRFRLSGDALLSALPIVLLATPLAWHVYGMLLIPLFMVMVKRNVARNEPLRPWLYFSLVLVLVGVPGSLTASMPLTTPVLAIGYSLPTIGLLGIVLSERLRSASGASRAEIASEDVPEVDPRTRWVRQTSH